MPPSRSQAHPKNSAEREFGGPSPLDAIFVERFCLGSEGPKVAVKDTIDIAGHATRAGSPALAGAAPAVCHADVVSALLAAGCCIVGKTNTHELAYGVTGINAWTGTPANPHFVDRIPGGSSSGSAAAVAAGMVAFAIGTDTGGSIRIPASCCGVVGLKPSYGRISRQGVFPGPSSLDCVGPLARTMADIEHAMTIMDPLFRRHPGLKGCRLGIVNAAADPAIGASVSRTAREITADCGPVVLKELEAAFEAGMRILAAENWRMLGAYAAAPALGQDVRARLLAARNVTAEDVAAAEHVRTKFSDEVDGVLEHFDALVLPTMPGPPLKRDTPADPGAILDSTTVRPFNLSGHPAISLPLPPKDGFSIGLQLVGRRGEDAALCALGRLVENLLQTGQPAKP